MVITCRKSSMDQPRKVVNPARGQLNRENEYQVYYIYIYIYILGSSLEG